MLERRPEYGQAYGKSTILPTGAPGTWYYLPNGRPRTSLQSPAAGLPGRPRTPCFLRAVGGCASCSICPGRPRYVRIPNATARLLYYVLLPVAGCALFVLCRRMFIRLHRRLPRTCALSNKFFLMGACARRSSTRCAFASMSWVIVRSAAAIKPATRAARGTRCCFFRSFIAAANMLGGTLLVPSRPRRTR